MAIRSLLMAASLFTFRDERWAAEGKLRPRLTLTSHAIKIVDLRDCLLRKQESFTYAEGTLRMRRVALRAL